ncbi:hypothetical protein [Rhodopirellula sp. MGV]|uniref:hypothetical protein n=1 Tax=Rhodopirellula sp. MGV TaxID=2023130 RepID=UPI000B970388|nr:hypothetical protein [Rhodopirellula sp. MGV]OYP32355.1 hypothetical protein CGZ80_20020 [Rhodopirellula sp. MGV]PNY35861.1 hypothetical protein C2E31_15460 [Rhodopirellula baltica]
MSDLNETLLFNYTSELKSHYEKLNAIIDEHANDSHGAIEPIREQMALVKQTEEKLRPIRETYLGESRELSGQLQAITDETIDLVKSLMPKLAQLEKVSVDSLRRLFPRIQGSVRGIQMQNAYRTNNHS